MGDQLAVELEGALHIKQQESIIAECEEQCRNILNIVDTDVLSVETEVFTNAQAYTKSTIGLMVKDLIVDNMLTGAPAYASKQFKKGDVIQEIDGQTATRENMIPLLIGADVPGSLVTVKFRRGADEKVVTLKRACTAELADKKRMFELFTRSKDIAQHRKDAEASENMDAIIDLWTKMLEADQVHDEKIVGNVQIMQQQADTAVKILQENLAKLHAISLTSVVGAESIVEKEAELVEQLGKERLAIADLQAQLARIKAERDKATALIPELRKQIQETKDALELDDGDLKNAQANIVKMSMELEKELQTDVGENGGVGIVRKKPMRALRAAPPGSGASLQPAPLTSSEVKAVVEDKKLEADTFSGIARLKQELAALKRACGASDEALAAKDQQIKDLMAHLARLDQDLAKELQKEEVLAKQLADEKRKESELEAQIVQDRQVFATKEELIADLKKRLADALKKNDSCDDLIASLRKQLAALELGRDYAKNEAYDLKKQIEDLTKELDELKIKYAPCPNKIAGLQTELAAVKAALAPCQGEIKELKAHVARLDSKLSVELEKGEELMAHIARLDRDLAAEISKEQALAEKLAFEQRKKQEMSKTLDSTKKALDQDESQIAADKVQLANKDQEIADLKARLATLNSSIAAAMRERESCDDTIASLRRGFADLEKAKNDEISKLLMQIKELKAHLARLDKKLADELDKEESLSRQLQEEKRKEAELDRQLADEKCKEQELQKSLSKVKADLDKDEKKLAEDLRALASKDAEIADLKKKQLNLQHDLDNCKSENVRLQAEYDKCPPLIAELRKQIQETKDALELDDAALEHTTTQAVKKSSQLEEQFGLKVKEVVKSAGIIGSLKKYAFGTPADSTELQVTEESSALGVLLKTRTNKHKVQRSAPPAPQNVSMEVKAVVKDKRLEADTLSGINSLRRELTELRKAHAISESSLADANENIQELMAHLARFDKDLHEELDKEHELERQLAEEKKNEKALEDIVHKTKLELEKDERQLAEDVKIIAAKDAEIADLKKKLASLQKIYDPCPPLIDSLRKQLSALELSRDYLQNTLDETKQELNALKIEHAPCPNLIAALRDELEKFKVANAELKAHLARLDKKLAAELEKEEKLKRSLQKTQEDLAKDEKLLVENKQTFELVYESKDAELAKIKKEFVTLKLDYADLFKDNGAKTVTIDSLRIELSKLAKQKNAQIEALKARIAGLDKKLLLEIEVEEELDKRLAAEQQKEAELKRMLKLEEELLAAEKKKGDALQQDLKKTEAMLKKDEAMLAEDKKVFASKDAEIAHLKKKLQELQKEHERTLEHADELRFTIQERDVTISKQNLELSAMKDELVDVKALYAPCPSQIKALKEHIARLDKELSLEIEVKEELDKRLAAEQRKEAELDAMLAIEKRKEADLEKHLNATKEKLAKEEKQLAEDKETFNRVYESKDAEIADLKKRLASTELKLAAVIKEHKPCASTIAGLRKTITELQLSRDTLKAAVDSKDAQLDEVKKMLGDQLMEVLMKLLVEHRDMKVQLESITKKHDDCECRTAALQDELAELKKEPESNMRFA